MDTHEAGRAKAAWQERNKGEDVPGTGQDQPVVKPSTPTRRTRTKAPPTSTPTQRRSRRRPRA